MPTFFPPKPDAHLRRPALCPSPSLRVALALGLLGCAAHAHTQTLAQKNWAGSGVSVETWWRRGVFYRIDPTRFQAPNEPLADDAPQPPLTPGDLAGIARRLDYIQSLGVDAIVLASAPSAPAITPNTPGWDDLARAAAERRIRIIVALPAPASQAAAADAKVIALARAWLTQGVAGLYIPVRSIAQVDGAEHIAAFIRQLHALIASVPGDRILLAEDPGPNPDAPVARALATNVQLTASPTLDLAKPTAAALRAQLSAALTPANPLIAATRLPATTKQGPGLDALDRTLASLLLGSRAAVLLDYGQELGLLPAPGATLPPLMQWSPSNRTPRLEPPPPPRPPNNGPPPSNYATFKPYVPPLPRNLFRQPPLPEVIPVEHPVNARIEPNSLPGFTNGELPPADSQNGATANVALEDTDPNSLLNLYRHLIQLHHDNPSLRNGTQTFLDHDADNALLWLRQAPASTRTAGSAIVACNLSAKALTLDLNGFHVRAATLRTLQGTTPTQTQNTITLPPYAIFVGESSR